MNTLLCYMRQRAERAPTDVGYTFFGGTSGDEHLTYGDLWHRSNAAALGLPEPPCTDETFFDLGMDSLTAVELTTGLDDALGPNHRLGPSIAIDYPTIESLAQYLSTMLADGAVQTPTQEQFSETTAAARESETQKYPSVGDYDSPDLFPESQLECADIGDRLEQEMIGERSSLGGCHDYKRSGKQ